MAREELAQTQSEEKRSSTDYTDFSEKKVRPERSRKNLCNLRMVFLSFHTLSKAGGVFVLSDYGNEYATRVSDRTLLSDLRNPPPPAATTTNCLPVFFP